MVVFNHGYIPPAQYRTTERYVAYVDAFARNGYIVFRSDYRGHGNSEGQASGGYGSPAYTIDVLNAVTSIKQFPQADPERIGMWGHSMGGHITLRSMVVTDDIKAGVIWAGVAGSYTEMFERWHRRNSQEDGPTPTPNPTSQRGRWRRELVETYGTPDENPEFWAAISPNFYLSDLSGPIQLHHGAADSSVPVEFSETLQAQIEAVDMPVELYLYENDNHNISTNFEAAMERSIQFFDTYPPPLATAGQVSSPAAAAPTSTPTINPTATPLPVLTEAPTMTPTATLPPTPVPETIACNGVLTPAQTEGPFYTPNTPERANLVEAGMGGIPVLITGKVLNQNCEPVVGAKLDFWQTDDKGQYDNNGYRMRGHQFSHENGEYRLETIVPGLYPGRTPHIHVKIFAPDGQEILTSQIYFSGVSDQVPDGIFRADLLAQDLPPESDGRRRVGFNFVVSN